jgi:hypothetical protein
MYKQRHKTTWPNLVSIALILTHVACVLPAMAAMSRRLEAAEHAAREATAEAGALRSALLDAETINAELHAQLHSLAAQHDAAQMFAG